MSENKFVCQGGRALIGAAYEPGGKFEKRESQREGIFFRASFCHVKKKVKNTPK
jgi:hypothetical protein